MIDRWKIDGHFTTFLVRTARIPFSSPAFTRENPFSFDISPEQNTLAGIKSAARRDIFYLYTLETRRAVIRNRKSISARLLSTKGEKEKCPRQWGLTLPRGGPKVRILSPAATITRTNKLTVKATWIKSRFFPKKYQKFLGHARTCRDPRF